MSATRMVSERRVLDEDSFVELVVWQLDKPLKASTHRFKYRLAFVVSDVCVLRYDNEAGKGDHRHAGDEQIPYVFESPQRLLDDFFAEVAQWVQQK